MLKFPVSKPIVPFIASQRLSHLRVPAGQEFLKQKCLEPELFAVARQARKSDSDAGIGAGMPEGCSWEQVLDREAFLMNLQHRRLCLTIDAGIGKTSAMIQTQYLRGACLKGHLVIGVEFDNLPEDLSEYVGEDWLLGQLQKDLPPGSRNQLRRLLMRRLQQGQVTLLVDALDQITLIKGAERLVLDRAAALSDFLHGSYGDNVHCVVAGRPPAIDTYWNKLFAKSHEWEFAQIDLFNEQERIQFLGTKRAAVLWRVDADVIAVPRMLEMLCRIDEDSQQLRDLRTASDIYWLAIDNMLDRDVRDQADALKREPALYFFSLLAFECLKQGFLNGVSNDRMGDFLQKIVDDRHEQIARFRGSKPTDYKEFKEDLRQLGKLNTVIEYGVLDNSETLTQVIFRDRTLLDFFAGLWVTNHIKMVDDKVSGAQEINQAVADDIDWLRYNVLRWPRHSTPKQFWRLAAEMPAAAFRDESYSAAMSVLYESRGKPNQRNRLTEMIYRSWPRMLRLAGYTVPPRARDADLMTPTHVAQRDAWQMVESVLGHTSEGDNNQGKTILKARIKQESNIARRAVMSFLSEYPGIYFGTEGESNKLIARDFETWFVNVPEAAGMPLFCVGDDGDVPIDAPFLLAKYTVTNQLFNLFDVLYPGEHLMRHPAARISWFDAWSACLFFHGRLPSEDEWEYACRGRPGRVDEPWDWCFGSDVSKLKQHAHYSSHWGDEKSTVPVGQLLDWSGLHDMHGNVWEWTSSWDDADHTQSRETRYVDWSRVLRGGSFFNEADDCRSAARNNERPSIEARYNGVRVARARKS